jgi:hypothetical protein
MDDAFVLVQPEQGNIPPLSRSCNSSASTHLFHIYSIALKDYNEGQIHLLLKDKIDTIKKVFPCMGSSDKT